MQSSVQLKQTSTSSTLVLVLVTNFVNNERWTVFNIRLML